MKTDNQYDPNSLANRVRDRLEKRARGTLTGELQNNALLSKPADTAERTQATLNFQSESDQFLGLLLAPTSQLTNPSNPHSSGLTNKYSDFQGTKNQTSPLKLQEKQSFKVEISDSKFNFSITNLPEGEVRVSGAYVEGRLKVVLGFARQLDLKQQEVLVNILRSRLSAELGVPLEVEIDRGNR